MAAPGQKPRGPSISTPVGNGQKRNGGGEPRQYAKRRTENYRDSLHETGPEDPLPVAKRSFDRRAHSNRPERNGEHLINDPGDRSDREIAAQDRKESRKSGGNSEDYASHRSVLSDTLDDVIDAERRRDERREKEGKIDQKRYPKKKYIYANKHLKK